jgi:hypothetical protein
VARGVLVPRGTHEIVMTYDAPGLIPGVLLTLCGLLACVALWRQGPVWDEMLERSLQRRRTKPSHVSLA